MEDKQSRTPANRWSDANAVHMLIPRIQRNRDKNSYELQRPISQPESVRRSRETSLRGSVILGPPA